MYVQSVSVTNYNPAKEYQWTDKTGSYESIKLIDTSSGSSSSASGSSASAQSSGSLAVASVHNDCGSQCQSNTTCCGSDSQCSGNAISQRCCPNSASFCGCISNRGFCSGSVYQAERVNGSDTFGSLILYIRWFRR